MADININRDELTPEGYIEGRNPTGASDKTIWVLKFTSLDGRPLALFINYAVHGTVIGVRNTLLTGDLPGATSRFVEQHYGGDLVALWTSGAAGDQNPIVMSGDANRPTLVDVSAGDDQGNNDNFQAANILGRILGEEVIRASDSIKTNMPPFRIRSAEKVVTCPGQEIPGSGTGEPLKNVKVIDSVPVNVRLGVIMLGNITITAISAEVVTKIYEELRERSPFTNTIMITLANGRIGYVADNASFDIWTQEAIGSPLKRGCAERTILNGLLDLIQPN